MVVDLSAPWWRKAKPGELTVVDAKRIWRIRRGAMVSASIEFAGVKETLDWLGIREDAEVLKVFPFSTADHTLIVFSDAHLRELSPGLAVARKDKRAAVEQVE